MVGGGLNVAQKIMSDEKNRSYEFMIKFVRIVNE